VSREYVTLDVLSCTSPSSTLMVRVLAGDSCGGVGWEGPLGLPHLDFGWSPP
jgi:hypothetical protein